MSHWKLRASRVTGNNNIFLLGLINLQFCSIIASTINFYWIFLLLNRWVKLTKPTTKAFNFSLHPMTCNWSVCLHYRYSIGLELYIITHMNVITCRTFICHARFMKLCCLLLLVYRFVIVAMWKVVDNGLQAGNMHLKSLMQFKQYLFQ